MCKMYFSDIDIHIPFISGPNFWLGTLFGSNSEHGTWFHVKSANEMAIYILLQMLRMNTRLKMTLATRLFVACNSSACSVDIHWICSVDICILCSVDISSVDMQCGAWSLSRLPSSSTAPLLAMLPPSSNLLKVAPYYRQQKMPV